jgi:HlyD family secretion protein
MIKKLFHPTKKKIIFLAVILVVIIGIAYSCSLQAKAKNVHTGIATTTLKKSTLQNTVSVSGTVHSDNPVNVYTTLAAPVAKTCVSVGDKVKKGDILAVLDSKALQKDLEQQQYATTDAETSANLSLQKAQSDYTNAMYLYNNDLSSGLMTAKSTLSSAKGALDSETSTWNYDQYLYKNGQLSKMELDQEQVKYNKAVSDYSAAQKSLTAAQNQADQDLKAAKNAYDAAVAKCADKSQRSSLEKLQQNMQDSNIVAPADGTITYKNVTVGVVPNGILFKIENTGDLIVDTQIKELDAAVITAGKKVIIKSDATGSTQIPGMVTSVAPAATESTEGTSDVTFAAKIKVTGSNPNLKIGMKAKLQIVEQEKSGIFVVPYDALVQKEGGTQSLFIAEKQGTLYRAKEVPVKTGMESDVSVEISGSGLTEGAIVVNNPDGVKAGDILQLSKGA